MRHVSSFVSILVAFPIFGQGLPELSITNYRLAGEELRVSRNVSDFEYRADVVNRGQSRTALTASVTSLVPSVQILRGSLRFPLVPANSQIASNDTILIRVDRSVPFDFANLKWMFSAAEAPYAHAGANQTVALGSTVVLNGSASSSTVGAGALSYNWAYISRPQGSTSILNNPSSVNPSFVADAPGSYTLQLTVTNSVGSSQAAVTISTLNSAPVAKAGPNQSVAVGATVHLNGSASSDVDGDALSYVWTLLSRPSGSTAALSSLSDVRPQFIADKAGTYTAQLVVSDGKVSSAASIVTISTQNTTPVANPGIAQTVNVGSVVQLNGAGSTDVDGDTLTYQWSFTSIPSGSLAVLINPTAVNASFIVDRPGIYVVQLIVDDGKVKSAAATVTISTNAIQAPMANPGANQTVKHGALVALTGAGTDPQSLPLTYKWSLTTKPLGSNATLSATTTANSGFSADRPGTYVAQLIVNNGYLNSNPATVTITTTNTAPVARPGTNQTAVAGAIVSLNGSASSDADGDALSYSWSFASKPAGSTIALSAATSETPTFVPDVAGTYVVQLIVSDAFTAGDPATVTILITSRGNIVLPGNTAVELGGSAPFPVSLTVPATEATVVALTSSDPAKATLSVQSVLFGQGQTQPAVHPRVNGIATGAVTITASATGLSAVSATVQVGPGLNFSPASIKIGSAATENLLLTLTGAPPSGSLTVTLTSSNPGAATVPQTVVIAAGANTVSVPVTGVAPGSTVIRATAPATGGASVNVVVNTPPLAKAGQNLSVSLGATVELDGSGSSDPDNDTISYTWTLLTRPSGSTAALSSSSAVRPTFVADKSGAYTAQLIVNDGRANSAPSTVTISTVNTAPLANPGSAQTVNIGAIVHLNGAGSTDPEGDTLTYQWSFQSTPPGSAAALSNATAANPSFTADRPGTYVVQLIVDDGQLKSAAATVNISTNALRAPTANAGANQTVKHGTTVALSGTGTDPQSLALTYQWSLSSRPAASNATLSTPAAANSGFTADKPGTYVAQLIVSNGYLNSDPATVTITATNMAPVARPGTNQSAVTGSAVSLNGTASSDADGDTITYSWSFTSRPVGSSAALSSQASDSPTFVPDIAGPYSVQLIVSDAFTASAPVSVTISVTNRGNIVLPVNATAELGRSSAFPVVLSEPAPQGGVTVALSTNDPSRVTVSPASVFIPRDATVPAVQPQLTGTGLGSASIGASATGYTGAQAQVRGTASIAFVPATFTIDEGENKNLTLTLSGPAPAGGVTFALTLSAPGVTTVPATVTIPQNQTTASVRVTAVTPGTVVLRATAPELADATASLTVNRRDILLPSGVVVPPGELVTFPVTLAAPAPQATFVALTSSDPSKVGLSVQNLLFNQGQTQPTAQPKVSGIGIGSVTITATAFGLNSAVTTVQTGYSLEFSQNNITINGTVTEDLLLVLSGPPSQGLSVTLSSSNPAVATVPQTILIAAGTNTVNVPITGVGSGSTVIRAVAPGTGEASASVTVTTSGSGIIQLPASTTIQQGQTVPFAVTLSQPAPAGGTTITLISSDFGKVTILPSTLSIAGGQTQPTAQAQITGTGVGSASITASATGYASVTRTVQVNAVPTQIIAFGGTPQSTTTGSSFSAPLVVVVKDSNGNSVPGVTVTFNVTGFGPGGHFENGQNTATTNLAGFATSATFIANQFAGTYTVTASVAGVASPAVFTLTNLLGNTGEYTISVTGTAVGRDLQAPLTVRLSRPAPAGGLRIEMDSSDPVAVLLAGRPNDTGRARLVFTIGEGLSVVSGIYVHGLQNSGVASVTASAPGWYSGSATITMTPSGFVLSGPDAETSQFVTVGQNGSAVLRVTAARLDGSFHFAAAQPLRGGTSVTVALSNSTPSLGSLSPASVTLNGGDVSGTSTFTAAGSTSGSTTLTASVPAGFSRPGLGDDTVTATVVAATVIASTVIVAENLQTTASVRLTSPAPAGGIVLTLVSNDPTKALLSTSPTTTGSASISFQVPAGRTTSQEFYVQGLAGNGQTTYSVSGPGVRSGSGTIFLARSGFVLNGPFGIGADFFTTIGAESTALSVTPGRLDSSLNFVEPQQIRGGLTVAVTATNTDTAVGSLSGSPIQFTGGSISGTLAFRPSAAGATTLALSVPPGFAAPAAGGALTAIVRAPGIVISDGLTIGKNLQSIATVLIGQTAPPGGLLVTLTSNSPLLALSNTETGIGSASVTLTIPAGETSANYYLQASGSAGEVTYTATAPGYVSRTATVKLAPSGIVIGGPLGFGFSVLTRLDAGSLPVSVMTAVLDPVTAVFIATQPLAGGLSLNVSLVSTDSSVGTVPSSVTITGGSSSIVADFVPVAFGTTRILVETPAGYIPSPFTTLSVTVTE